VTRVGVVGCGAIGRLHVGAYRRLGAAVAGVADPIPGRARALAAEHDVPVAVEDYRALLERDDVDAVSVCVPTALHAEVAVASARAAKHVLVEKPIALTEAEADEIAAACQLAGVTLMVGQSARFDAINLELKALVSEGGIGRPVVLHTFAHHGWFWRSGWRGWQIDPARSGGHLVHNGVHEIDLACWLFGSEPVRVLARGLRVASPALETFDAYALHLTFADGAALLAELSCAAVPPAALLRSVDLIGSEGEAHHETTGDGLVWTGSGAEFASLGFEGSLERELAHWLACLDGRAEPSATAAEGRRALSVALAAERSAVTGEPVELDAGA